MLEDELLLRTKLQIAVNKIGGQQSLARYYELETADCHERGWAQHSQCTTNLKLQTDRSMSYELETTTVDQVKVAYTRGAVPRPFSGQKPLSLVLRPHPQVCMLCRTARAAQPMTVYI